MSHETTSLSFSGPMPENDTRQKAAPYHKMDLIRLDGQRFISYIHKLKIAF